MEDVVMCDIEEGPRAPSSEEAFLIKMADEAPKNSIDLYNQVLRQTLQMIIAMMGGTFFFLDKTRLPLWALVTAMVLMFASAVAAFVGVLPYRSNWRPDRINDIRQVLRCASDFKGWMLFTAITLIILAFFFAFLGILIGH